jgi:hypothetical protein
MDSDSESCKAGGTSSKDILEPDVLLLSGQSVLSEASPLTSAYQINGDIRSITKKHASVVFERVEGTAGTSQKQQLFYLAHPTNAQYRTDIPAKYYVTSVVPEMVGNIRLEVSKARFQKASFKAILSPKKTAADELLFDEGAQHLLFDIQPNWKGSDCYKWTNFTAKQVAIEEKEDDRYKLSVTSMSQELRDALVATWLLRLWHDMAESRQAKRECSLKLLLPSNPDSVC